jgi:predicted DNA-binding protein (MmcQ/YjbR family)
MFNFVVKYCVILKFVPGLPHLFDAWLKLLTLITNPKLFDWIDDIEKKILTWPGTTATTHKYGGLQFNYGNKELGHIHSNGLLDMLLNRQLKQQLMQQNSRVQDHHILKKTGWLSFYMESYGDKEFVLELFEMAYKVHVDKTNNKPNIP